MTELERRDYQKYFKRDATGFSKERNDYIINQTIKHYEAMRKTKRNKQFDALDERVEATAAFLMHMEKGGSTDAEKYFGKTQLARLRGQRIVKELVGGVIKLGESDEVF